MEPYGERNIVERLIRRLKGFRRGLSRYDKLDIMHPGYVTLACISEAFIRQLSVNGPQIQKVAPALETKQRRGGFVVRLEPAYACPTGPDLSPAMTAPRPSPHPG